jgi:hypothetical protein
MELYTSLYENTKNIKSPLEDDKKAVLLQTIPKLDEKGHEIMFFLIRMYHIQQVKDVTFGIPYDSTVQTNRVEFDLDKFPTQLQHMLYMFAHMHYEYLSYEQQRRA